MLIGVLVQVEEVEGEVEMEWEKMVREEVREVELSWRQVEEVEGVYRAEKV